MTLPMGNPPRQSATISSLEWAMGSYREPDSTRAASYLLYSGKIGAGPRARR
jgi:hypothetical protein